MLHIATIAGPLDVLCKKGQRTKAIKLFLNEYGLNLTLLALLQVVIWMYLPSEKYMFGELIAVAFLLFLSIIQMYIDGARRPIQIFHSGKYESGISVRVAGEKCWAFFNHYALPVGRKHGVHLRLELHRQAKENQFLLFCYAQNNDVARYYLKENPNGIVADGNSKRPLLVWDYREENDKTYSPFQNKRKSDLFGLHSARNSGSLPL